MAYTRGTATNIVVGAAALFVTNYGKSIGDSVTPALPGTVAGESYKDTLSNRWSNGSTPNLVRNLGYTSNGLDLTFTPTFGDVQVDQLLDTARLFKSGMTVTLKTSLAEGTLENLLLAITQKTTTVAGATAVGSWSDTGTLTGTATVTYTPTVANTGSGYIDIVSGNLGDYPVERGVIAVGSAPNSTDSNEERIYVAYRAVSIQNVTVSNKRDSATMFDVEFRLLPDANGAYGKIVDRTY